MDLIVSAAWLGSILLLAAWRDRKVDEILSAQRTLQKARPIVKKMDRMVYAAFYVLTIGWAVYGFLQLFPAET